MSDAAIKKVIETIKEEHSLNIQQLGKEKWPEIDRIPSGSLALDQALGGGWPRGRCIEIFGAEASGKTLISLMAIAQVQKQGGNAAFIDAEHALSYELASNFGVDTGKLFTAQPDSGEQALEAVMSMVESNAFDMIVVDSVDGLVPQSIIEGNLEDATMGVKARMMSKFLQTITAPLGKSKTVLIFINQLRQNLNPYQTPFVTPGGMALKFYSSVRVQVKKESKSERTDTVSKYIVGHDIHAKVVKNKTASPFREALIPIMYHDGILLDQDFVNAAKAKGLLVKPGRTVSYAGTAVEGLKAQTWNTWEDVVAWVSNKGAVPTNTELLAALRQEIVSQ